MQAHRATVILLALLLAFPLLGFFTAIACRANLNSTIRKTLLKQFPDRASAIGTLSVSGVCQDASVRSDAAEMCSLDANLSMMSRVSVVTAMVGTLMLLAIYLAGRLARMRRRLLLYLFSPGRHLVAVLLSLLTIVYAALAIGCLYFGESFAFGEVHIGIILGIGVAALFGVLAMLRGQVAVLKKASTTIVGHRLIAINQPALWQFVNSIADKMSAERPSTIIAGLEPNFYVLEADVQCLDGSAYGRTLYISLPLCRILSHQELAAVLSHEFGHFKGRDTAYSRRFYPVYRGATTALANLQSGFSSKGGVGQLVLLPPYLTLAYFLNCFSVAESEISRDREFNADNEAARNIGGKFIASALVKVNAYSAIWPVVRKKMADVILHGNALINASTMFADIVFHIHSEETLGAVAEDGPIHPTDTHPPLSARLKHLNIGLGEIIEGKYCEMPPLDSAISLIQESDTLEAELTGVEQAIMIRRGEAVPSAELAAGANTAG